MSPGSNKKYHYVYQTKNLVNGKTYIGVHSTDNLNDGYIGCGIKSETKINSCIRRGIVLTGLLSAVKKYGYHNFKKEILSFYDTREEAIEEERFIVDERWVKDKSNYNLAIGGSGGKLKKHINDYKHIFPEIKELYESGVSINKITKIVKCTFKTINWIIEVNRYMRPETPVNEYIAIRSDGYKEVFTSACEFAKKFNLRSSYINKIIKGERRATQVWDFKLLKEYNENSYQFPIKEHKHNGMKLQDSEGRVHIVKEGIKNFCKEHGLQPAAIFAIIEGKMEVHKGYRIISEEYINKKFKPVGLKGEQYLVGILSMFESGSRVSDIVRKYSISHSTVNRILKKYGKKFTSRK